MKASVATWLAVFLMALAVGQPLSASNALQRAQELYDDHRYREARAALEPAVGSDSPADTRLWLARIR